MTAIATAASRVGAGVSLSRNQSPPQSIQLKDQGRSIEVVGAAALHLIRNALSGPDTTGHDLDVLA